MNNEKLDMKSPDLVMGNIERIAELFPHCVTETGEGRKIDFDLLRQELSDEVVEGAKERYRLEWAGKREAIVTANMPTTNTLRPVREDSVDFDHTENVYIEGDNLEVLKLLQESYLGKIKMIYIDPPYNTGNDFIYRDNFVQDNEEFLEEEGQKDELGNRLVPNPLSAGRYHSDWLSMMYPRLKLARNLLTDDGVIFISIGEHEVHNLRKMCDEIFGEINFLGCAGRISKKANNQGDYWAPNFDYVLTYASNREFCNPFFGGINYSAYKLIEESGIRKGEVYQLIRLYMTSLDPMRGCSNQRYYIECPDGSFVIPPGNNFPDIIEDGAMVVPGSGKDKVWRWSQKTYLENKDKIVVKKVKSSNLIDQNGNKVCWNVFTKTYLNDVIEKSSATPNNFIENHINQTATHELNDLDIPFEFAKPLTLIKYMAEVCGVREQDIVLDFFSGSATTAHAVMQLNADDKGRRKFIMVQLPEKTDESSDAYKAGYHDICEIGKERIRRAAAKIKTEQEAKRKKEGGNASVEDVPMDMGFRVYRLDNSNMLDVYYRPQELKQASLFSFADNIKTDRSAEDLVAQVMLDWGLPLSLPIERTMIAGKTVYMIDKNALYCCFEEGIDEQFAREIVRISPRPLRIVFRDASFADDTAKENVKQLLRQLAKEIEMKVI